MHVEANLLDSVGNVGASKSQVLEGAGETPVGSGISHQGASIGGYLGASINRGGAGVVAGHAMSIKDVQSILPLRESESVLVALNCHAEEVM
jgi:hypothetical protein